MLRTCEVPYPQGPVEQEHTTDWAASYRVSSHTLGIAQLVYPTKWKLSSQARVLYRCKELGISGPDARQSFCPTQGTVLRYSVLHGSDVDLLYSSRLSQFMPVMAKRMRRKRSGVRSNKFCTRMMYICTGTKSSRFWYSETCCESPAASATPSPQPTAGCRDSQCPSPSAFLSKLRGSAQVRTLKPLNLFGCQRLVDHDEGVGCAAHFLPHIIALNVRV